jgi:hypothetical protein
MEPVLAAAVPASPWSYCIANVVGFFWACFYDRTP